MDELEYRHTYNEINERSCAFEKAILTRRCACARAQGFNLADREGVACGSEPYRQRCTRLLELLHENARFALRMSQVPGSLPHNKELRVQMGGLLAIQGILDGDPAPARVPDVAGLTDAGIGRFGAIGAFPMGDIIKGIAQFRVRRRRG